MDKVDYIRSKLNSYLNRVMTYEVMLEKDKAKSLKSGFSADSMMVKAPAGVPVYKNTSIVIHNVQDRTSRFFIEGKFLADNYNGPGYLSPNPVKQMLLNAEFTPTYSGFPDRPTLVKVIEWRIIERLSWSRQKLIDYTGGDLVGYQRYVENSWHVLL